MRISSSDVEAVKFPVTIRGYAEDEVDRFLDVVIETMTDYEQREDRTRREIDRLRTELENCRASRLADLEGSQSDAPDVEDRVKRMLEEASRTSEQIVADALDAAEQILEQIRGSSGR